MYICYIHIYIYITYNASRAGLGSARGPASSAPLGARNHNMIMNSRSIITNSSIMMISIRISSTSSISTSIISSSTTIIIMS